MKPHPRAEEQDDLLRPRLAEMIDLRHELAKLAELIDWEFFEREWAGFFPSSAGRPATLRHLAAIGARPMPDAAGGGAAVSPARLSVVGRGRGRTLGGEPVLPALLRRDVRRQIGPLDRSVLRSTPAPSADRSFLAHPLAQARRRRRRGMAAGQDHPDRPSFRDGRGEEPGTGIGRHDGHGKEHRPPHRRPALREGAAEVGGARRRGRHRAAPAGEQLAAMRSRPMANRACCCAWRSGSDVMPTPASSNG